MLCEESIIIVEARNALSIPYNTKYATPMKTHNNTGKFDKHCKLWDDHNVETCKKNKE
jgi:hypothetical protein